ncbi:DUF6492 family protein [Cohnella caldifontis]|uniref:DUF6492 family protein n=1 Tax=Cohnella caldifontis TaxID=3027471 RepID=UPI0023EE1504|nr:DUF6492 family protein [Cohnella sp. YIM B05605]
MPAIDILIPAIEKDLATLPRVIDSARAQIRHPIRRIFVVAPKSDKIRRLCKKKNCRFVDETTVLPLRKADIRHRSKKWERSGWMLQQLLKMSGDVLCATPNFLVMDADTVLIRPHTFMKGKKTVYYCRKWSQPEYFRTYRRLMGKPRTARVSFVAHYMLFNRAKLARLKKTIEAKHHTRWYRAILRKMDRSKPFAFSEYETYGNYVYANNPRSAIFRSTLNKSLHTDVRRISAERLRALAKKYRSLSFHKRGGYVRKPGVKRA